MTEQTEQIEQAAPSGSPFEIIVAQRGWVFAGRTYREGDELVITNAVNIRRWGTTRGLGELAAGPLPATKLDEYGTVRVHALAVVARISADGAAWKR